MLKDFDFAEEEFNQIKEELYGSLITYYIPRKNITFSENDHLIITGKNTSALILIGNQELMAEIMSICLLLEDNEKLEIAMMPEQLIGYIDVKYLSKS